MIGLLWRLGKLAIKIAIGIAFIAVLIAYARLSELGDMRQALLSGIEKSFGGRLSINGPVELDLTFPPSISMEDVKVKNAKWGKKPDMLKVKKLVAEVDLLPLIRGKMAVPRLRMIGVDIVVEKKKNGGTNWDELNEFETAAGGGPAPGFGFPFPGLGSAGVAVTNGTLTVIDQTANSTTTVSLPGTVEVGVGAGAGGGAGAGAGGGTGGGSGGGNSVVCP